jgi:Bax protein
LFSPKTLAIPSVRISLAVAAGLLILITLVVASRIGNLPDMTDYTDVAERKAAFFDYLTPIIESQNLAILEERKTLTEISRKMETDEKLLFFDKHKLKWLADRYQVGWDKKNIPKLVKELESRIDSVPISLVLVQAAKESGWGTSKFARQGNNLFGQWCYRSGCGIVPDKRTAGARHEVRVFDSVSDAVEGYLHNINSGKPYASLRDIRARLRRAGKKPDGSSLAEGLLFYSQRRQAYVDEIKMMLHQYSKFQSGRGSSG